MITSVCQPNLGSKKKLNKMVLLFENQRKLTKIKINTKLNSNSMKSN